MPDDDINRPGEEPLVPRARPICPKCAMHMIAVSGIKGGKQSHECLRCGYQETFKVFW